MSSSSPKRVNTRSSSNQTRNDSTNSSNGAGSRSSSTQRKNSNTSSNTATSSSSLPLSATSSAAARLRARARASSSSSRVNSGNYNSNTNKSKIKENSELVGLPPPPLQSSDSHCTDDASATSIKYKQQQSTTESSPFSMHQHQKEFSNPDMKDISPNRRDEDPNSDTVPLKDNAMIQRKTIFDSNTKNDHLSNRDNSISNDVDLVIHANEKSSTRNRSRSITPVNRRTASTIGYPRTNSISLPPTSTSNIKTASSSSSKAINSNAAAAATKSPLKAIQSVLSALSTELKAATPVPTARTLNTSSTYQNNLSMDSVNVPRNLLPSSASASVSRNTNSKQHAVETSFMKTITPATRTSFYNNVDANSSNCHSDKDKDAYHFDTTSNDADDDLNFRSPTITATTSRSKVRHQPNNRFLFPGDDNDHDVTRDNEQQQQMKHGSADEHDRIDMEGGSNIVDGTCLTYGTNIWMCSNGAGTSGSLCSALCSSIVEEQQSSTSNNSSRFEAKVSTIVVGSDNDTSDDVDVDNEEQCDEHRFVFKIIKVTSPPIGGASSLMFGEDVVKYGDVIGLHSYYSRGKALGIRRKPKNAAAAATFTTSASGGNYFSESAGTAAATGSLNANPVFEVGFFRKTLGHADKWLVRHAYYQDPQHHHTKRPLPLQVGTRLSSFALSDRTNGTVAVSGSTNSRGISVSSSLVRSGDMIVLQNVSTGGILSLSSLSSSLDPMMLNMDAGMSSIEGGGGSTISSTHGKTATSSNYNDSFNNVSLITQGHGLQSTLVPHSTEMWQPVPVGTPACPIWHYGDDRPYLDGNYLLHRNRNPEKDGIGGTNDASMEEVRALFGMPPTNPASQSSSLSPAASPAASPLVKQKELSTLFSPNSERIRHSAIVAAMTVDEQEMVLMEELLSAMLGLEGRYIYLACAHGKVPDTGAAADHANANALDVHFVAQHHRHHSNHHDLNDYYYSLARTTLEYQTEHQQQQQQTTSPNKFQSTPTKLHQQQLQQHHTQKYQFDESLVHLVERILPLCTAYTRVNRFILTRLARYEYGYVAQSLASAMEELLTQYQVFVCQIEHLHLEQQQLVEQLHNSSSGQQHLDKRMRVKRLTMPKLWCHIQPWLSTMQLLSMVAETCISLKGGELINALHTLSQSYSYMGSSSVDNATNIGGANGGPEHALSFSSSSDTTLSFLIRGASKPYFKMLNDWIHHGRLYDPYAEFLVDTQNLSMANGIGGGTTGGGFGMSTLMRGVDTDVYNTKYWEECYSLRHANVLYMLQTNKSTSRESSNDDQQVGYLDLPQKILAAGKYWNVVKECGHATTSPSCMINGIDTNYMNKDDSSSHTTQIQQLTLHDEHNHDDSNSNDTATLAIQLHRHIDNAFSKASSTLLNLIHHQYHLMDTLISIKHYILLYQGDFFVMFLDLAETELFKDVDKVSRGRVQSLLTMSVQQSSSSTNNSSTRSHYGSRRGHHYSNHDEVNDEQAFHNLDLYCEFANDHLVNHLDAIHSKGGGMIDSNDEPKTPSRHAYGKQNQLTGLETLMFSYQVHWPLSLILPRKAMTNYQLLFRHLFFAKHVERRLFATWLDFQMIKGLDLKRCSSLKETFCLRQRMMHFLQNLVYYMMFEVIQPHWDKLERNLKEVKTIDEVTKVHFDFQLEVLKECLLTNRELLKILTKLMTTCVLFSDQMKRFFQKTKIEEDFDDISLKERLERTTSPINQSKHRKNKNTTARSSSNTKISIMSLKRAERRKNIQLLSQKMRNELESDAYRRMIKRISQVFDSKLAEFMTRLMGTTGNYDDHTNNSASSQYHSHLANLYMRLDYNGFIVHSSSPDSLVEGRRIGLESRFS